MRTGKKDSQGKESKMRGVHAVDRKECACAKQSAGISSKIDRSKLDGMGRGRIVGCV